MTERASGLAAVDEHLDQLSKSWEQTLKLAESSGAPPAVLQRAQEVITTVTRTRQETERQLGSVLTLQSRVAEQDSRVSAARSSLERVRRQTIEHLLDQDSPPIWSIAANPGAAKDLFRAGYTSFRRQLTALRGYAKRNTTAFAEHAFLILLVLAVLYWERPKVKKWVQEDSSFERIAPIFKVPVATAVAFSYLPSRWIYPLAPQLLVAALGVGSLLATTIVLRALMNRRLYPILNALLAIYLLEQLRAVGASLTLLSRSLFLVQIVTGILFAIWLIRSTRLAIAPEAKKNRSRKAIKIYARMALVGFSAALAANALGYVALANLLGQAVLGGAYIALVLYAITRIAEGLLFGLLKIRPFSMLGVVHRHRSLLEKRGGFGLRSLSLILWLGYTLELLVPCVSPSCKRQVRSSTPILVSAHCTFQFPTS